MKIKRIVVQLSKLQASKFRQCGEALFFGLSSLETLKP